MAVAKDARDFEAVGAIFEEMCEAFPEDQGRAAYEILIRCAAMAGDPEAALDTMEGMMALGYGPKVGVAHGLHTGCTRVAHGLHSCTREYGCTAVHVHGCTRFLISSSRPVAFFFKGARYQPFSTLVIGPFIGPFIGPLVHSLTRLDPFDTRDPYTVSRSLLVQTAVERRQSHDVTVSSPSTRFTSNTFFFFYFFSFHHRASLLTPRCTPTGKSYWRTTTPRSRGRRWSGSPCWRGRPLTPRL